MKTYTIRGKLFQIGDTWKQYEMIDQLLGGFNSKITVEVKEGDSATLLVGSFLEELMSKRLVPKLLSLILVQAETEWNEPQASENEEQLAYVRDPVLKEVLQDFFSEKASLLNGLIPYLSILPRKNTASTPD